MRAAHWAGAGSHDVGTGPCAKGKVSHPIEVVECKGLNHFEIIETLAKPDGILGKIALKQIGLA